MRRMSHKIKILILTLIVFFPAFLVRAQDSREDFGENRVQYKNFHWRYLSSENFDVYYYDNGDKIADDAIKYLDGQFDHVTDVLGYSPYSKTKIFIYNSITDLQQSNVGISQSDFTVGGQTDFFKSQVEIAYPGTQAKFKKELLLKFSQMLISDMMYGGSLSDMFQSSYLLSLPDWFINGAANYIAYGWNVEMDDYMRDLFNNGKPHNLNKYSGDEAGLIGQSVWNFIVEKYGTGNVSNILNLTRIIRNEEKSISNTLGLPFKEFIQEWTKYYRESANEADKNYKVVSTDNRLMRNSKDFIYNKVKISPDNKYLAYSQNLDGKYFVRIRELDKHRVFTVMTGGYKVIGQDVDYQLPLISWIDNNNLAVIATKYGNNYIWFINIHSGRKVKKELTRLNNIRDFDVSESGNLAVLSADVNGQSDLFLISLKRNSIKRLTNDVYDDVNPQFVPGTPSVIFSSNRPNDTLSVESKLDMKNLSNNFNLFIYNIDTTRNLLLQITNAPSHNIDPIPVSAEEFYFLSDQQGIYNVYKYQMDEKVYQQITKYSSSILNFDIGPDKKGIVFTMYDKRKESIFYEPGFDLDHGTFTLPTRRQNLINAKYVAQRIFKRREEVRDSMQQVLQGIKTSIPKSDTSSIVSDTTSDNPAQKKKNKNEFIDTDNYVFDKENVAAAENQESFLTQYRKFSKESEVMGPFDYQPLFSANNVVTSFVIDPLLGFGINLQTQMNDMLGDNRFIGGVLATTDLRSGNLYAEYQYLKHTVDFTVRFERKSIYKPTEAASQKYYLNKYEVGASLPLNTTARISIKPFLATTRFYDLNPTTLITPGSIPANGSVNSQCTYGGFSADFTFDNTVSSGQNLIEGRRGKVSYTVYQGLQNNNKSFSNFYVDLRNYQKISRELVFATRLFYGRFYGNNKQDYLLGGINNWLFSKTNTANGNNPLNVQSYVDNSNLLFLQYVTDLRGFEYNQLNGNNALLFNAELRFPIIRYFYRGPIASNFLRNLLLLGFYDIGSAWTGRSPFATENSVNTQIIDNPGSPFQAQIQNFKNPWLQSYGFGIRTVLLGYYMKFDMAYPIEDYQVSGPKYYVSLGYDF